MTEVLLTRPLAELAAAKRAAIRTAARSRLDAVLSEYPEHERLTWDRQQAAATAYRNDPSSVPALLQTLADKRGISVDDLAAKILDKAAAFEALAGEVVGTQQALEDQVRAAEAAGDKAGVVAVPDWPPDGDNTAETN
jgi:hypothetical protein